MTITHIAATLLLLTFSNAYPSQLTSNAELREIASWRFATFNPPPGYPGASSNGQPVQAPNVIFTGIQPTKNRLFIAMPRSKPGQPITFGWVPRPPPGYQLANDTPINAFPDYDWHRAAAAGADSARTNCSALVSVFYSKLDRCGRLWVVDSGVSNSFTNFSASCPPKILAFDPVTGRVLHRFVFPSVVVQASSLFTNMALDDRSVPGASCSNLDNLFIYVADSRAPSIVVYDVQNCDAWRYGPPQAFPDPDWGRFMIGNETFNLMQGILGLTLSNCSAEARYKPASQPNVDTLLYFQAVSSNSIYSVSTSALKVRPIGNGAQNDATNNLPIKLVGWTSSQSVPLVCDPKDSSLLFAPFTETAIARFQPANNLVTVEAYCPVLLQGVNGIYAEPEVIFVVSSRDQKFIRNTATSAEINLRILVIENNHR